MLARVNFLSNLHCDIWDKSSPSMRQILSPVTSNVPISNSSIREQLLITISRRRNSLGGFNPAVLDDDANSSPNLRFLPGLSAGLSADFCSKSQDCQRLK